MRQKWIQAIRNETSAGTMGQFDQIVHIKRGVDCFFSLHDCVYGVQYNMYSWFFFF